MLSIFCLFLTHSLHLSPLVSSHAIFSFMRESPISPHCTGMRFQERGRERRRRAPNCLWLRTFLCSLCVCGWRTTSCTAKDPPQQQQQQQPQHSSNVRCKRAAFYWHHNNGEKCSKGRGEPVVRFGLLHTDSFLLEREMTLRVWMDAAALSSL